MRDHPGGCSAKVTRLPSPSNTSTIVTKRFLVTWGRFSPLSKTAPDKVKLSVDSPGTERIKVSSSASTTRADGKSSRSPLGDTRNTYSMDLLNRFGPEATIWVATKFHWKCQRPLRELRAMMRERGYTKQDSETR